ncbi:MAG: glycosyl transferase group 1 [Acidobacteria bacterium]|nr:glycosyl transferase group 1 [Acidobacteriota bacterium]
MATRNFAKAQSTHRKFDSKLDSLASSLALQGLVLKFFGSKVISGTQEGHLSTLQAVSSEKVKALLISGAYYPPQVGGISHFLAKIAATLGPDHVCCLTAVPRDKSVDAAAVGPTVYRFPSLLGHSRISKAAAWASALTIIMARDRPGVIMLGSAIDSSCGLWLRRRLRFPFVLFVYGNELLAAINGNYPQALLAFKLANRVMACSNYTAKLAEAAGIDPNRIEVIYPGCDTEIFRPLPVRPGLRERLLGSVGERKKVILTVGNLVSRKGHDMVIRALPILKKRVPDFVYLIVGDGPYRGVLEGLAKDSGVNDQVIFTGKMPDEDVPAIHALSDVFVMPSREDLEEDSVEGFGMVFLEANACNKPVIGGCAGGVPEAVEAGVTGLLVDPHSPAEIAEALAQLLTDTDLARRLGEQGRARVVREFQWKEVGERVLSLLGRVQAEAKPANHTSHI